MTETANRSFRRPAVEIAAARNSRVIAGQQRLQGCTSVIVAAAVLAIASLYTDLGWIILGLAVFAAVFGGLSVKHWRAFGERYRLVATVRDSVDEQQAKAWQLEFRHESRRILLKMIVFVALSAGVMFWVATHEERWWVILLAVLFLVYFFSSVKLLAGDPTALAKHTVAADENSCRIVLFRAFTEESSALARSALAPILAGYGRIDIVLDETLEHAEAGGTFGGQIEELGDLGNVFRFTNAEWKTGVSEIIQNCDIVIIDITTISPGVMWELAQSYKNLPPYRIYGIINAEAVEGGSLKDYMGKFYGELMKLPEMPTNVRPYIFIFAPSGWQQETLAEDIHRRMLQIVAVEAGILKSDQVYDGN